MRDSHETMVRDLLQSILAQQVKTNELLRTLVTNMQQKDTLEAALRESSSGSIKINLSRREG